MALILVSVYLIVDCSPAILVNAINTFVTRLYGMPKSMRRLQVEAVTRSKYALEWHIS
jgi:hypothetical protein